MRGVCRAAVIGLALQGVAAAGAHAQAPNEPWRTIVTAHARVHFPAPLESLGRRAAAELERAWLRLAGELVAPRGPVDLVVTDHSDFSNGAAAVFPTNRIVIHARPPINDAGLRFSDDWLQGVITHELAHVFHLDRSRGVWQVAQAVFGRNPAFFPNTHAPRWLLEGIAIEYESRLAGGGRLNGTELARTLDAAALDARDRLRPAALSLAAPAWPAGLLTYFGGAQIVHAAVAEGGSGALRRFVDGTAGNPIPFTWTRNAREAFGTGFDALVRARGASPRGIADSGREDMGGAAAGEANVGGADAMTPWAGPFWEARAPRWRGDSVYFTAMTRDAPPGLYRAAPAGAVRVERRNSTDAFGFGPGGMVYAELDFADPYRLHSSLRTRHGEIAGTSRFAAPDVRADGAIVAVKTVGGFATLVICAPDGTIRRETPAPVLDEQWSAPRWSRDGTRIAAVRWERGGTMAVVVLDTLLRPTAVHGATRAVLAHPSWDVGDRAIYFTSDQSGASAIYRVRRGGAEAPPPRVERVSARGEALYDTEISPDGTQLAAFAMASGGYSLVRIPAPPPDAVLPPAAPSVLRAGLGDTVVADQGRVQAYSSLRSLRPRYWIPTLTTSDRDNPLVGFYTSGSDVVGRHAYAAQALWDAPIGDFYGDIGWSYSGFGSPVVDIGVGQGWDIYRIANAEGQIIGEITRRNRAASLAFTLLRPRVRSGWSLSLGGEFEWRRYRSLPGELAELLSPPVPDMLRFPALLVAAAYSRTSRSPIAPSAEDGFTLSTTARRRWNADAPSRTSAYSVLSSARAYKSFETGDHGRHVVSARVAHGWAEPLASSAFSAGGVSGASMEVLPGYRIGDAQRAFGARGFDAGSLEGIRAWGAGIEYRAPLGDITRGFPPLPIYLQRASVAAFADAASAWCPTTRYLTEACPGGVTPRETLVSVGAELHLDAAVDFDSPTRFRMGVAAPVRGRAYTGAPKWRVYFSLGATY